MKIALFGNSNAGATAQIRSILVKNNVEITPIDDAEMVFSVGGDGTFLRAAAAVGRRDIPILGINAGHLGFLADVSLHEIEAAIPMIVIDRQFHVERRALLALDIPECRQPYQRFALNEIAVLKRDQSSMVKVSVKVDGAMLNQYAADGVIFATPTGSTAYALSAGGAILQPQSHCLEIVPIAAHSLSARPLVVTDSCELDVEVSSRNNLFLVAVDGLPLHLTTEYRLRITHADFTVGVVRRPSSTFFDTLREKLNWGNLYT